MWPAIVNFSQVSYSCLWVISVYTNITQVSGFFNDGTRDASRYELLILAGAAYSSIV